MNFKRMKRICVNNILDNYLSDQGRRQREVDVERVCLKDGRPKAENRERGPTQNLNDETEAAKLGTNNNTKSEL
jgi:hypothetical protein